MIVPISVVKYVVLAAAALTVIVPIHNWRVDSLRLDWQKELDDAVQVEKEKCTKEKIYAKESSHALQSRLDSLSATYVRLLKTRSNLPASNHTTGSDGSPNTDGLAALTIDQRFWNDRQAAQLIAAQGLIRHIYQVNHQEELLPAE